MDNSREMVLAAFREVAEREFAFATVEAGEEHEFSPRFRAEMEKLMARQSRGPQRRLSGRQCRAVLIAALLTALLLVTCSASVRGFVGELIFGISQEGFTDFATEDRMKPAFEEIYEFIWIPANMNIAKRERGDEHHIRTYYENNARNLQLIQSLSVAASGSLDYVHGEGEPYIINGDEVFIYSSDEMLFAKWIHDGYYFSIYGTGAFTQEEAERMVSSLAPIDGE